MERHKMEVECPKIWSKGDVKLTTRWVLTYVLSTISFRFLVERGTSWADLPSIDDFQGSYTRLQEYLDRICINYGVAYYNDKSYMRASQALH